MAYLVWLPCTYKIYQIVWSGALVFIISFIMICIIGSSIIEDEDEIAN